MGRRSALRWRSGSSGGFRSSTEVVPNKRKKASKDRYKDGTMKMKASRLAK